MTFVRRASARPRAPEQPENSPATTPPATGAMQRRVATPVGAGLYRNATSGSTVVLAPSPSTRCPPRSCQTYRWVTGGRAAATRRSSQISGEEEALVNSATGTVPATLSSAATTRPRLSVLWPIGWAAFLLYGSLIPFDVNWAVFGGLLPGGLLGGGLDSTSVEDVLINILLYFPIGLLVVLSDATPKPSPRWRLFLAVLVGAAVSLVAENLQAGAPTRVASWLDVALNTFGALAGATIALALRGVGAGCVRSIRNGLSRRPYATLAVGLTAGLLFYGLAPFDFVTDTQGLHASFLRARWSFTVTHPAVPGGHTLAMLAGEFVGVLWYALLGCLHALSRREARRSPLAAWLGALKSGLLVAGSVEVMQLFLASHCFELMSLILRSGAVFVGAWCGAFLLGGSFCSRLGDRPTTAMPGAAWALLVLVQLLAVVAGSMGSAWPTLARLDLSMVRWMPFEAFWHRSALAAASTGLEVVVTYAALGLTVAGLFRYLRLGPVWPLTGLAVASFAACAEALELATGGGTPDITGPVLALASVLVLAQLSVLWPSDPAPQSVAT